MIETLIDVAVIYIILLTIGFATTGISVLKWFDKVHKYK